MEQDDIYSQVISNLDQITKLVTELKEGVITGDISINEVLGIFLFLDYQGQSTSIAFSSMDSLIRLIGNILEKCPDIITPLQEYLDRLSNNRITDFNLN